jgi:two-component system LytT family sensor kinase
MSVARSSVWPAALLVAGAWTVFGLYSGLQTHYRSALWGRPIGWGSSLFMEVAYTTLWAILTPAVLWVARRFPLPSPNWIRNSAVHLIAMFAAAVVTKLAWDLIAEPPYAFFQEKGGITFNSVMKSVSSALDIGTMLYCVVVLGSYAYAFHRRFQEERLQASELHRQFTNAQLQALKMQLHPHFLFNALHAISGLVHDDPNSADRMIARLSEFLRMSLETSEAQQVPLSEELRFLNLYLDIERVRFDDRLSVEFDVPHEASAALVPNLVLQPLVENAIRHGISHRISDGQIRILARRHEGTLVLSVADNGPGSESAPLPPGREGVGLTNTRSRLHRLYGQRQQISLVHPAGGGLEVRIVIPFETAGEQVRLLEEDDARAHSG